MITPIFFLTLALIAANPAEAQCDYTFCGGTVTNPTATVTSLSGIQSQCSLVQTGINLGLVNAEECARLPEQEQICCPEGGSTGGDSGGTAAQSCFVCGSDKTFNKEKSWMGEKICATLDTNLAEIPAGSICDSTLAAANAGLDLASFCECEGAVAPGICSVCGDGQEVSTTAEVPDEDGLTCAAAADYIQHLKNATECAVRVTDAVKSACCVDKESSAINLSVTKLAAALIVGFAFVF